MIIKITNQALSIFRMSLGILFTLLISSAFAQKDSINEQKPIGIIPAFAFDTDLGIKYGAVLNYFDFRTKGKQTDYSQYLYLKLTNTTKNTTNIHALFESEEILKNANTIIEIGYFGDKKLNFYGFNGAKAYYNEAFIDPENENFINKYFYSHDRKLLSLRFDIQRYMKNSPLRILSGLSYKYFHIFPEVENGASYNLQNNILANYINWKIIEDEEIDGGNVLNLRAGIIYDTRNHKCNCSDGIWMEAILLYSPPLFGSNEYLKSSVTFRFYKDVVKNYLTFKFRFSSQNTIFGKLPFYQLPFYTDSRMSHDGLGGAFNLRGIFGNRVVANGFILSNSEIIFDAYEFTFIKQNCNAYFSIFSDFAYITQNYEINTSSVPLQQLNSFFTETNHKPIASYGLGFYFIYNDNNVISVNWAISKDKQFGQKGLYVGSAMLF